MVNDVCWYPASSPRERRDRRERRRSPPSGWWPPAANDEVVNTLSQQRRLGFDERSDRRLPFLADVFLGLLTMANSGPGYRGRRGIPSCWLVSTTMIALTSAISISTTSSSIRQGQPVGAEARKDDVVLSATVVEPDLVVDAEEEFVWGTRLRCDLVAITCSST